MIKNKYYVVWVGRKKEIFNSWDECKAQTDGFSKARFKSFFSLKEAEAAFYNGATPFRKQDKKSAYRVRLKGRIIDHSKPFICVDGAFSSTTGEMEYQGVIMPENRLIFHAGPFPAGTNNIAEFLAIVQALQYNQKRSMNLPIYSDSFTAIGWVQNMNCNTALERSEETLLTHKLIEQAEVWLNNNKTRYNVHKWHTKD